MADNRLAVLVVHDRTFLVETEAAILETDDLALCHVGERRYISGWQTVLNVLAHNLSILPRPDLLLIDARFEEDRSAPDLGRLGVRVNGESADPRGLLYGAVLAAQFNAIENLPFGFVVYSADLPSIADDPYAQTFFGLLEGLTRRFTPSSDRGFALAQQMRATPTGAMPRDSWGAALLRFRQSLQESLGQCWSPDYSSFASARDAVRAFLQEGKEPPEAISVRWTFGNGKSRTVLLRSLLADCRTQWPESWDSDAMLHLNVLQWLDDIAIRSDFIDAVLAQVVRLINSWYTYPDDEYLWNPDMRNTTLPAGDQEETRWVQGISFIVLRALNLRDWEVDQETRVLDGLQLARHTPLGGLAETSLDTTMARALTFVLLGKTQRELSPAQVLSALGIGDDWPGTWSLDAHQIVVRTLEKIIDNRKHWPKWAAVRA